MKRLSTTKEIDEMLAECERAAAISDNALRDVFNSYHLAPPTDLPSDPFSVEYLRYQMDFYQRISGKAYDRQNEVTKFDVAGAVRFPYPYQTNSHLRAGEHYQAMGFLLRSLSLGHPSRILEFGPGWGNTTLALARLGHKVTAVDIEVSFCELIKRRAALYDLDIEVINDDFYLSERLNRQFDAVLFFECFHHCADHNRLLTALDRVVAPGGAIYFGSEPISSDFPMPWGLRLDGESMWAVRRMGWMELGFRDDYFREALTRKGWLGERFASRDMAWNCVWKATRRKEFKFEFRATDPRLKTAVGIKRNDGVAFNPQESGLCLFGPYIHLPAGNYAATLVFAPGLAGEALMDVAVDSGQRQIARQKLTSASLKDDSATLTFFLADESEMVEVRLFSEQGFQGVLKELKIQLVPSPD
ncbi:class I SAM-dependent methyltransferase [Methylosinus sp. H3A]|uniref:class I SAM-dependent methyltransferase n=1 Tax=Methylosinus sp. H3A TaxID=2785786 RepID=UPI0018C25EBE|nr:class I SAM-dependent methyltransferase [Methylosinus sp. H3A]MBG0812540.1 class I SAM-dependent methyltransferase [Methylosinus sp. H3A]